MVSIAESLEGDPENFFGYGAYAAPETARGAPDARGDVFSVGRLLTFIMLDRTPGETADVMDVNAKDRPSQRSSAGARAQRPNDTRRWRRWPPRSIAAGSCSSRPKARPPSARSSRRGRARLAAPPPPRGRRSSRRARPAGGEVGGAVVGGGDRRGCPGGERGPLAGRLLRSAPLHTGLAAAVVIAMVAITTVVPATKLLRLGLAVVALGAALALDPVGRLSELDAADASTRGAAARAYVQKGGKDLRGMRVENANLSGLDLTGARLDQADLTGTSFAMSKLNQAQVDGRRRFSSPYTSRARTSAAWRSEGGRGGDGELRRRDRPAHGVVLQRGPEPAQGGAAAHAQVGQASARPRDDPSSAASRSLEGQGARRSPRRRREPSGSATKARSVFRRGARRTRRGRLAVALERQSTPRSRRPARGRVQVVHHGEDARRLASSSCTRSRARPAPPPGARPQATGPRWLALAEPEAHEPRAGEDDRVEFAGVDLAEARIDVAAHGDDSRSGRAAAATRSGAGCSSRRAPPAGARRASRASARRGRRARRPAEGRSTRARPGREDARDVLDRVHGEVRAAVEQRLLNLLHEETLAADLRERAMPIRSPWSTTCSSTSSSPGLVRAQGAREGAALREGERRLARGVDERGMRPL